MATKRIRVWDPCVRLAHWVLASLVIANWLDESGTALHRYLGYAATAVVALRLLWGLIGPPTARFSTWWPTPRRVAAYLAAWRHGSIPRPLGHNPLGAAMALCLWVLVAALGVTGWMMGWDAYWGEEWLENVHTVLAYALLVCAIVHVIAVIAMSMLRRENLIAAMITGDGNERDST